MKEQASPQYLRPESHTPESERPESPAVKAERAIGSASELADASTATLERAGKNISGLREGPARSRLEKRQGILARRVSGFRKKITAALAGLALAVGAGRANLKAGHEAAERAGIADESTATRRTAEESAPKPVVTDLELVEDDVNVEEQPPVPPKADPFAAPDEKKDDTFEKMLVEEAAEAEENRKFEEEAKQEELSAMRDYADLVIDDLISADSDIFGDEGLDKLHEVFRERAKDIAADEEEFIHQGDEAYLTRYGIVMRKVLEAPETITPEERPFADEARRQLRESGAEDDIATGPTDDTQE